MCTLSHFFPCVSHITLGILATWTGHVYLAVETEIQPRPSLVHGRCLVSWSNIAVGNIPCTDDFCCFSLDLLTPTYLPTLPGLFCISSLSSALLQKLLLGIRIRIRAGQLGHWSAPLLLAAPTSQIPALPYVVYIQWHCASITFLCPEVRR